ncbi:hypothetical protein STRTUCAR8_00028 [Streptomyces turgidiscabies Car8]|uniref:Uncharacterized protein n=1 Tax=Streptomyces turgidiscabies (strain Car8) TaxID=698760 RepID=L7FDX6_STRT8|nr:hypothetical protein [Streptomyces turgidiscabies]ELP69507.1 hypothetical protein STRTUCAR8_00028 [Streptomyces turgidiscabies Car8]
MPDPITGEGLTRRRPKSRTWEPRTCCTRSPTSRRSPSAAVETATAGTKARHTSPTNTRALYLLRRAALSDRLSLAHPDVEDFLTDAVQLAHQLAEFDRKHDTHVGPIGPSAIEWDPSHRPYVRQEYDHWGW